MIWYAASRIRTWLYVSGRCRRHRFPLPVFVVGNISTGGTGKSPHTELLARQMLTEGRKTAVLSRGYGRKTKGFRLASTHSLSKEVGDEPLMIKRALPAATVAVCENRAKGIRRLLETEKPELVVMDDAYQHLRVEASCYFLLTTFAEPFTSDLLLPAGNLRESRHAAKRAACVIVTKVPHKYMDDSEKSVAQRESLRQKIAAYTTAPVIFSEYEYSHHVKNPLGATIEVDELKDYNVLLITAVANPILLLSHLGDKEITCRHLQYGDHHAFTRRDLEKIKNEFLNLPHGKNIILTTEKDMARIIGTPLAEYPVFSLAVKARIRDADREVFDRIIHQTLDKYKH